MKVIGKGDVFWIPFFDESGTASAIVHPQVVLQETVINQSRIDTLVVCGISTNMKRAFEHGNVLLELGEADLPKRSIVVVSQVSTVKKSCLGAFIGALSDRRLEQIFAGIKFVQSFTERAVV